MFGIVGALLLGAGVTPAPPPCATLEGCLALVNTTKPERCVEALQYAATRWPTSVDVHQGLALCLGILGRDAEALAAATRCLELSPAYAPCLSSMGTSLWKLGRRTEARAYMERVVSAQAAEGRFPHALKALAEMDIEEGAAAAARRHLDQAWGLVAQDATKASLHRIESQLALLAGDGAAALEHLRSAQALVGAAEFRILEAVVLAWQGSFDAAAAMLRSVGSAPIQARWREVADRLGEALARSADVDGLRRWVERDPTEEHAWFILALERHLAGDAEKAATVLAEGRTKAGPYLLRPPWSGAGDDGRSERKGSAR